MRIIRITGQVIKWIIIILIILFSLATFMGKNYGQTTILLLIALILAYWPKFLRDKIGKNFSLISRIAFILLLLVLNFTFFKSGPKTTIYTDQVYKTELMNIYDEKVSSWPDSTEDIFIETKYGEVHLLVCGSHDKPPLVMLHAASMGAHSWAENLEPLLDNYRIYSFDNIGEGNKSELTDAMVYPNTGQEIADLYSTLLDSLRISNAPVFGASNGGFIAQCLAYYYPEKVESMLLFGPMGLTQLTKGSIIMLSAASMYPFQFIRDAVAKWALGEDEYCNEKYGDWFNCIMKGTIPSVAQPIPMKTEQKQMMNMPILLFLGTEDRIVGDADTAEKTALQYPNIEIEVLESGHLIAVEQRYFVNQRIKEFLNLK
jgi:pimeloyl-ACP methyl ester carboxylesterase